MPITCPGCNEVFPDGGRFCGACGETLPSASAVRVCPLCREELPEGARFCGACGQALGGASCAPPASQASLAPGIVAVPLIHHAAALEAPEEIPCDVDLDVDVDIEQADTHFQLVEVDTVAAKDPEEGLARLLRVSGLAPNDPRLRERLSGLGRVLGRRLVARAETVGLAVAAARAEFRRLLRLARDEGYREAVRAEVAPYVSSGDVARTRSLVAEGHLHAARALLEQVLAAGPRVEPIRMLAREVIRTIVARAHGLEREGDAAFGKGKIDRARALYEEAIGLLENDRRLLERVERLDSARGCR